MGNINNKTPCVCVHMYTYFKYVCIIIRYAVLKIYVRYIYNKEQNDEWYS